MEYRGLWIMIMVLSSALVGWAGGMLARAGGAALPDAVTRGFTAFAAALAICMAIYAFVRGGKEG